MPPRRLKLTVLRPTYALMLSFVLLVSLYDSALVYRYRVDIRHQELNPVGRTLIRWDGGEVRLFLITKALGTGIAVFVLVYLNAKTPRLATPVIVSVATFQLGLLCFLCLAVPSRSRGEYVHQVTPRRISRSIEQVGMVTSVTASGGHGADIDLLPSTNP